MPQATFFSLDPVFLGHVIAFGAAAVACFVSILRARLIQDEHTRKGLVWLLLTSGGWATAHVGFFLTRTTVFEIGFYQLGLIIGIGTVGPWLYFCSAFTGRNLHRDSTLRWVAVGTFVVIVLIKLTNPWHGMYFQTEPVSTPFSHLAVKNQLLHWVTMGLAYALATVGYFMLFERFWQIGKSTLPLALLVGITGLPVLFDIFSLTSPLLIDLTYEPLGVAIFAVGVLYVYQEEFETIRLTGNREEPAIVLNADDEVREFNPAAQSLLPRLEHGQQIDDILPETTEGAGPVKFEGSSGTRYYEMSAHPFASGNVQLGQVITLHDVTEREQYKRRLERQRERLDQFASTVSHDLRNPLKVAQDSLELAELDGQAEDFERASTALDRIEEMIEDLLTLAREGQAIDETEAVTLSEIAARSWNLVATKSAELKLDDDLSFQADPDRLQQLLENLFRNAVEHGGSDVVIVVGTLDSHGFFVQDDGPGIPEDQRDEVLSPGYTTSSDGTGFGLNIVQEIVEGHGWDLEIVESPSGGARFEFTGVETR